MTVTLELTPRQEQRLRERAEARGVEPNDVLREIVDSGLGAQAGPVRPEEPRSPGLHAGQWWIADDFDEPLPDSFWLGEE